MSAPPARISAAVALLAPRTGERVLEVGCGTGVALELVAAAVGPAGRVVGLDRSTTAIARAARRNAAALAAGTLALHAAALAGFDVAAGTFDAAFAVNVNCFWTGPAREELATLRRLLVPGGRLLLVFDAPDDAGPRSSQALETVERALADDGWAEVATVAGPGAAAVSARNRG